MTKQTLLEALSEFPDDADIRFLRWDHATSRYDVFLIHPTLNQDSLQKYFDNPTFCMYAEQRVGVL